MDIDWTGWKWDGYNNVYCRCGECYAFFGRPLKWRWIPMLWESEAGTEAPTFSWTLRQHHQHNKAFIGKRIRHASN